MRKRTASLLVTALTVPGLLGTGAYSMAPTPVQAATATEQSINLEFANRVISAAEQQQLMEDAQVSKEEAIKIAKDFVNLSEGFTQQNVSFQTNWRNQRSVWMVRWQKQEDRTYEHVSVTLDANDGEIVGMNRSHTSPELEASYPPKVDRGEAKNIAKDIIEEQFPDIADQIGYEEVERRTPLQGDVVYNLRFNQMIDDIPYRENYLMVRINGNGDLVGLDLRWDTDMEFPSSDNVLEKSEATSKMIETFPLRLQYRLIPGIEPYQPTNPSEQKDQYALEYAYVNIANGVHFDARKGTWVDADGNPINVNAFKNIEAISDQPLEEAPSSKEQELTQQQAIHMLQETIEIPDEMTLEHANYHEQSGNDSDAFWNFNWTDENGTSLNGRVDAWTGEILEYSKYDLHRSPSDDDLEQVLTYEEAKDQAVETVKQMVPWKTNEIALDPRNNNEPKEQEKMSEFTFHFQRLVNGIPVPNQTISVSISSEEAELVRFYQNWDADAQFPDATNLITEQEGKEIFLNAANIQLEYVTPHQDLSYFPMTTQQEDEIVEATMAYTFRVNQTDEPSYLDAVEGKWLSTQTGEPITDTPEPTDITDHWAEEALQLMLEYKAIDVNDDGEVNPNQEVTRGEVVKMLMLSTNPNPYYFKDMAMHAANEEASFSDVSTDSAYFPYVESAARQGWIDTSKEKFNPEQAVTREELATMIVRALGYDKLAEIDEIFQLDFNDTSSIKNPGSVSIVSHLEIMVGSNGSFRPENNVTRAEAAKTYYEFLKKRTEMGI